MQTEPVLIIAGIVVLLQQLVPVLVPLVPGVTPEMSGAITAILNGAAVLLGAWNARGRVSPVPKA